MFLSKLFKSKKRFKKEDELLASMPTLDDPYHDIPISTPVIQNDRPIVPKYSLPQQYLNRWYIDDHCGNFTYFTLNKHIIPTGSWEPAKFWSYGLNFRRVWELCAINLNQRNSVVDILKHNIDKPNKSKSLRLATNEEILKMLIEQYIVTQSFYGSTESFRLESPTRMICDTGVRFDNGEFIQHPPN